MVSASAFFKLLIIHAPSRLIVRGAEFGNCIGNVTIQLIDPVNKGAESNVVRFQLFLHVTHPHLRT